MKIILTGGSGFIGSRLVEKLATKGHEVIVLTRDPSSVELKYPTVKAKQWDGKNQGAWSDEIDGADAVLNFAGESIGDKRWTTNQKEKILNSRIDSTRAIIEAMKRSGNRPSVLVNASAVGYYGPVENGEVTETYPKGDGFLADICARWEEEAFAAERLGVRVVILRQGVVLDKNGGALPRIALPYKLFVGAPIGSGKQWFPWIHRDDVAEIVMFVLAQNDVRGVVNAVAPDVVTMKQFCRTLGKILHRPSWPPVPGFILKVALGELSSMILTGQRVAPAKLEYHRFRFRFPLVHDALTDIFS